MYSFESASSPQRAQVLTPWITIATPAHSTHQE